MQHDEHIRAYLRALAIDAARGVPGAYNKYWDHVTAHVISHYNLGD